MQLRPDDSRNVARCALMVLIASVLAPSIAKPPAPQPPPTPPTLTLSSGMNAVLGAGTSLMLFKQNIQLDGSFAFAKDAWTESAYGGTAIQLATIATTPIVTKGIVVAKSCSIGTKRAPQYGHYLNVFKNGTAGLWKTNYNISSSYVVDSAAGAKSIAADLDGDGIDEIILKTAHKLGVYYTDPNYGYVLKKTVDLDVLGSGAAGQGLTWNWRDFAVGRVVDGSNSPQVVIAGSYRDAVRKDHEYLFILDAYLQPMVSFNLYDRIGDFSIANVRIGDHDGVGKNEIWVSGWVNNFEAATYDNLVYAWTIEAGSLTDFAKIDADGPGVSKFLGPHITLGNLDGAPGEELIVQRLDPAGAYAFPHHVEVYTSRSGTVPWWSKQYSDRRATDIKVLNGYMFVMGFIPAASQASSSGHFLEIFEPRATDTGSTLDSLFRYEDLAGGELGGMAVGTGN